MEKTDTPKIRGISFSKLDLSTFHVAAFLVDDINFFLLNRAPLKIYYYFENENPHIGTGSRKWVPRNLK